MIVSDRELLELSAKAVGMEYPNGQTYCETMGVWGMLEKRPYSWWNPLTDDGDALRLAVKCKIDLILTHSDCESAFDHKCIQYAEPTTPDPCAATRRAIVRAAAEIGKEMK